MSHGSETGAALHHAAAEKETAPAVLCAVITASDSRTEETDASGRLIRELLQSAGHQVLRYHLAPDDPEEIRQLVSSLAGEAQAILINGGTGISARDSTYDAVRSMLQKELPGFGELFRMLSWQEIGAAAMLSRAVAGVCRDSLVFSMPGSTAAVALAMQKLILPELRHLVWEISRQGTKK